MVPSSGSTIQRWVLSVPSSDTLLLQDEAVAGPRLSQRLEQHLLGAVVGGGDEVAGPLARHLQVLDLAEVALQAARP